MDTSGKDGTIRHVMRGFNPQGTRYDQINAFERMLCEEGTVILKFFLHISPEEQRRRLQARTEDPKKCWKFQHGDLEERKL